MNKRKKFIIIGVCLAVVLIIAGGTYSYYRGVLFNDFTGSTITHGLNYYINYTKGQDITSGTLSLSYDYSGGISTDIELWKKDDTYDIYGHIYLDVNDMGENLSGSSALKYAVVNDGSVLAEGSLKDYTTGDSMLLEANIPLQTTKQLYTVYVWLDESQNIDLAIENENLSLTVRCEATMKEITVPVNAITLITDLYNPDTTEVNNGITYNLDSINRLMDDKNGNIRYYGVTGDGLKNYIYFNCSDYSNQTSATCEIWRIIGIIDGKVKIVNDSPIGSFSWDYDYNDDGVSTTYDNNWSTATLQKLLNNAYYKGEDTEYYNNSTTATSVKFKTSNTGLKNDATRKMISNSLWYLGACDSDEIFSNEAYQCERGEAVAEGNPTTWNGNIALMYPSDVGFASDFTKCKVNFKSYSSTSDCRNWMFNSTGSSLLTTRKEMYAGDSLWAFITSGFSLGVSSAPNTLVFYSNVVRPTVYLKSGIGIVGGDGSISNKYQISSY